MSTLYHVLGLNEGASHEQVKTAFRELARRFHPDVNAGKAGAEQRFKEVNQAYETLADPGAREVYDRALVCQATEVRQRRRNFAATAAVSFALSTSIIGLALWWMQAKGATNPEQARVADAAERGQVVGALPGLEQTSEPFLGIPANPVHPHPVAGPALATDHREQTHAGIVRQRSREVPGSTNSSSNS